jgi:hypothetical protein
VEIPVTKLFRGMRKDEEKGEVGVREEEEGYSVRLATKAVSAGASAASNGSSMSTFTPSVYDDTTF